MGGNQSAQHRREHDRAEHADHRDRHHRPGFLFPDVTHNAARHHQCRAGAQALEGAAADELGHALGNHHPQRGQHIGGDARQQQGPPADTVRQWAEEQLAKTKGADEHRQRRQGCTGCGTESRFDVAQAGNQQLGGNLAQGAEADQQ
ncbi:hypothetical protein D3C80_971750 [compost metagenome]